MKKLLVALTVVAFMLGVAGAGIASDDGYHQVFKDVGGVWTETEEAEMYSMDREDQSFMFSSHPSAAVCHDPYYEPQPGSPLLKTITNTVHLFPWIHLILTEEHLVWDVFYYGSYMAKGPIIKLQANCPVDVSFGTTFIRIPKEFDLDTNKIVFGDYPIAPHYDERLSVDDKPRTASLISDTKSPGTTPDVIDMYWWYRETATQPDQHWIDKVDVADELGLIPAPGVAAWYTEAEMDNLVINVVDSETLHTEWSIVTYEYLEIEKCDSEGKYFETFTFLVTPKDP